MKVENFADNLKAALDNSGMNRREFCQKIGICEATFSRLAQGRNVPSIKTVLSLIQTLGIPIEKLFQKKDSE